MARYKVILAYDGTDFHGSQKQRNQRTVQDELEKALKKLNWTGKRTIFAGRTDAGVHASGQVAVFEHLWKHPEGKLQRAINSVLPKDIRVMEISSISDDFHPRYDAVQRRYRYTLDIAEVQDPLTRLYRWHVWPRPDVEKMIAASQLLVGIHDFAALGSALSPKGSTIRVVDEAEWQDFDDRMIFEIAGNAFLYHMVRHIVFVLVSIGWGRLQISDLQDYLEYPAEEPAQGLAPAHGLNLLSVKY